MIEVGKTGAIAKNVIVSLVNDLDVDYGESSSKSKILKGKLPVGMTSLRGSIIK